MHCPHCGAKSASGLRFCKHCGGSLLASSSPPRTIGTIWALVAAIVAVVLPGLGITFGVTSELAARGIKGEDGPLAIAVMGLLVVLVAAVMLIRLLSRVVTSDMQARGARLLPVQPQSPKDGSAIDELELAQLSPTSAAPSVTEHTTRSFERRDH